MNIQEIAQQAVNGDHKAFSILYKKNKSIILNRIKMNTNGNKELAEDITQDAFVKAFNNIKNFNPNTNFSTWVYRIAKNCLIDHFRLNEQKNHKVSLDSPINEDDESSSALISILHNHDASKADDIMNSQQRKTILNKIINKEFQENSRQRNVLELRFMQELQYEEIAEILNIPLGTVKTDVRTIKNILKKELEKINFQEHL